MSGSALRVSKRATGGSWPSAGLALAVGLSGGVVWQAGRSTITPYVVEVDTLGDVRTVGPAVAAYEPTDAQIAYHLARFIENVRSLSIDPIVVRQNWLRAYDYATDRGPQRSMTTRVKTIRSAKSAAVPSPSK